MDSRLYEVDPVSDSVLSFQGLGITEILSASSTPVGVQAHPLEWVFTGWPQEEG